MPETIIISLGGSVIVPEKVDMDFLKSFRSLIIDYIKKGNKFVIFCGGGKLARNYQNIAESFNIDETGLDWIGIHATRLNASLLHAIFTGYADEEILIDPTKRIKFGKWIIMAAGWKPGWSTDYDAILVAKKLKVKKIINITNVDYIYTKDPKKDSGAEPIKKIKWNSLRKMFSEAWQPGLNTPFDPVATKEAEKTGMKVIIAGKNINNLKNILDGKDFEGTVIE